MKSCLIIADDHPMVLQGLFDILARRADLEVVATARDGAEAERLARTIPADLMVLDIALPLRNGIKVLEALRADGIGLPILIFSMYPPSQYVPYVRRAGAQGFVGKEADEKSLLGAIRRILRGQTSFPDLPPGQSRGASRSIPPVAGLSTRENAVLRGLLLGTPLVEIAEELGISPQSVTTYRRRILDKLEVDSNAELIRLMNLPD